MDWPYHLLDLTHEEKLFRRKLIDRYGAYAQLSALIPVIAYQLYRLGDWVYSARRRSKADYHSIPSSPVSKRQRKSSLGSLSQGWRQIVWWLQQEFSSGWGERGHWIAGVTWAVWLLFLCVCQTGEDYLHVTKRFGEVAVSQFPLHYMLSMKSLYSPLALAFNTSHEQLNPWHRVSGRVIYFLLALHASWYMNFFVQAGVFPARLGASEVIIGVIAFFSLTLLATTTLEPIRRWNYRVFFVIHLTVGVSLLPLLFFHASHLRFYVVEALFLFVFDIALRKLDTTTGYTTITPVEDSNLVKLVVPIPATKLHRFHAAPGQHVYLNIPPESSPPGTSYLSIYNLLYNPFTVASVSDDDITLVLRVLDGPTTKAISALTSLTKAKPPINIEGPLGSSRKFTNLAVSHDRILLVAGGVGATFILPIYKRLRAQLQSETRSLERATFVWSMRSSSEAGWADLRVSSPPATASSSESQNTNSTLSSDPNIKLFLTRSRADDRQRYDSLDDGVEMDDIKAKDIAHGDVDKMAEKRRPDLGSIVDDIFKGGKEEKIAVLVCGPTSMAKEIRGHVGKWVGKGREVWFHDETFGW